MRRLPARIALTVDLEIHDVVDRPHRRLRIKWDPARQPRPSLGLIVLVFTVTFVIHPFVSPVSPLQVGMERDLASEWVDKVPLYLREIFFGNGPKEITVGEFALLLEEDPQALRTPVRSRRRKTFAGDPLVDSNLSADAARKIRRTQKLLAPAFPQLDHYGLSIDCVVKNLRGVIGPVQGGEAGQCGRGFF